jgi:hypothetical protein
MEEELERRIIRLIATDRIEVPISSMSGKLKRRKPKAAKDIQLPESKKYVGERVYARISEEDEMKARTISDAVDYFAKKYPTHGKILNGIIAEKRLQKETHLYFGINEGCRLTAEDYLEVMKDLGFGEVTARSLCTELIEVSRNLSKKRGTPERSILIGKEYDDSKDKEE